MIRVRSYRDAFRFFYRWHRHYLRGYLGYYPPRRQSLFYATRRLWKNHKTL